MLRKAQESYLLFNNFALSKTCQRKEVLIAKYFLLTLSQFKLWEPKKIVFIAFAILLLGAFISTRCSYEARGVRKSINITLKLKNHEKDIIWHPYSFIYFNCIC